MKPIEITIYIYPSPSVLNLGSRSEVVTLAKNTLASQDFQRHHEEILKVHPNARVVEEESTPSLGETSSTASGYFAKYAYTQDIAGQVRPVESLLYVYSYVGDKWTIKYRITYPAATETPAAVDWFMHSLAWTIR
jgi:hypothetical protein